MQSPLYQNGYSGGEGDLSRGRTVGGLAVLLGLLLIVAFFLPWSTGFPEDQSGYDILSDSTGSDSWLGNTLQDLIVASPLLAGLGGLMAGLGLITSSSPFSQRSLGFRAWTATSLGSMTLWAAMLPLFLWSSAMLAGSTSVLKLGFWLTLSGAALLAIAWFVGLSSLPREPLPNSIRDDVVDVRGNAASAIAMLVGLALIVAFLMPWMTQLRESTSGWELLKQSSGGDHYLGNLLQDLILGGSALAGIASLVYGITLTREMTHLNPRGVVFRVRLASAIGTMAILAAFWPFFLWSTALLVDSTSMLKIGFWITLGGSLLLVVAALIGLSSVAATQQEPQDTDEQPAIRSE